MEIVREEKLGRFSIVVMKDEKGHEGIGISRRSDSDTEDKETGMGYALVRALEALRTKQADKKICGHRVFCG